MNTRHFFTAVLIAALGLAACSNNDEVNNLREEVNIFTTVNGASNESRLRAAIDPATGAGNLEDGDIFSLLMTGQPETGTAVISMHYIIGTTKLYWDEVKNIGGNPTSYSFLAYYPPYEVLQASQQINVATAANPDQLSAKATGINVGGAVNLVFKHIMHKLVVNLSSNYFPDMEIANVTLKNLKSNATVNAFDGTVDVAGASGTDTYATKRGRALSFIVAPQTLTAGEDLIEINIDGSIFTYKVPANLTALESGKILTLNLAVNRDQVNLIGQDISGWGTQDEVDDVIDYN